jgi:hypothetical protein
MWTPKFKSSARIRALEMAPACCRRIIVAAVAPATWSFTIAVRPHKQENLSLLQHAPLRHYFAQKDASPPCYIQTAQDAAGAGPPWQPQKLPALSHHIAQSLYRPAESGQLLFRRGSSPYHSLRAAVAAQSRPTSALL